jgi:hypothetical protein
MLKAMPSIQLPENLWFKVDHEVVCFDIGAIFFLNMNALHFLTLLVDTVLENHFKKHKLAGMPACASAFEKYLLS